MEKKNSSSVFKDKNIFVGIDVHKKRWVVSVRSYDLELKTFSMSPTAEELEKFLVNTYPGALFHIVYDPPRRTVSRDSGFTITFMKEVTI